MNVSPLDLRQQRFRTVMRGFDKVEVASFLTAVADDYEQALREADRMRQDVTRMEAALREHRGTRRTSTPRSSRPRSSLTISAHRRRRKRNASFARPKGAVPSSSRRPRRGSKTCSGASMG